MEQDQERLLEEATAIVREQAELMKRAIDQDNLRDALKYASNFLCELRTCMLSPRTYYELYMLVFNELQHLLAFFCDKNRHNRKMSDLYETVQHAGNIIPRLYLLITVGAAYIKSKEAPACDVLKDLTELSKGVQHPMRGLFLRFYLTQMCKDKLPDTGSEYEQEGGGNLDDAFDFLLCNFTESLRLWLRMHQPSVRDRQKRERERNDLRVLVGSSLVRMSQLEGMSPEFYRDIAVGKVLEQVVGCKDAMAQQYLLDCIIQVFSDEYHLLTLGTLLNACMNVQRNVNLNPILVNLLNRLSNFVQSEPMSVPEHVDVFEIFSVHLQSLVDAAIIDCATDKSGCNSENQLMDITNILHLLKAFLSFTLVVYPGNKFYIDSILGLAHKLLASTTKESMNDRALNQSGYNSVNENGVSNASKILRNEGHIDAVVELLRAPMKAMSLSVLELKHYASLMDYLDVSVKTKVAMYVVVATTEENIALSDIDIVLPFFDFISCIWSDNTTTTKNKKSKSALTANLTEGLYDRQTSGDTKGWAADLAKIVLLLRNPSDTDMHYALLMTAKERFGIVDATILMAFVTNSLHLVLNVLQRQLDAASNPQIPNPQMSAKKIFQFVHSTCMELIQHSPDLGLRAFLMAALVSDQAHSQLGTFQDITYECFSQALVCYEEEINESKKQKDILTLMVGCLSSQIHGLEKDNFYTIAGRITQHAAKLLKKPDQCRGVLLCSHLYWNVPEYRDSRRVLECLQRSIKTADIAAQACPEHAALFPDILQAYIYYFEQNNTEITVEFIQNLISLCTEHLNFAELDANSEALCLFRSIIKHLMHKKDTENSSKYQGLLLNNLEHQ